MSDHVNKNFLNKFLSKHLLPEEYKRKVNNELLKKQHVLNHFKKLEEKNNKKLNDTLKEETVSSVDKIFYRSRKRLQENKNKETEWIPFTSPLGLFYFNKDTNEVMNSFGQIVDFDALTFDSQYSSSEGEENSRISQASTEQRSPIYALAFSWPYDWMSSGIVFTQSTGTKNLLAYSDDHSVQTTNYVTDYENTGNAGCWQRRNISTVQSGFLDPLGGTNATKIVFSNVPGDYSQFYQLQYEIKPNTPYTYSFWVNTSLSNSGTNYSIFNSTNTNTGYLYMTGGSIDVSSNDGWKQISNTFTTGLTQDALAIYIANRDNSDGSEIYLWGTQLEEGSSATSFESTNGFKEFRSGGYSPSTGEKTYSYDLNLWANYASSIGATYIAPMVRAPFGRNTSRNLSTFMDGWTLSYVLKLSAQQLNAMPEGLKVISSNNFDYGEMLKHDNDKIAVTGITGFAFIDDDLYYLVENGYYHGPWADSGINLYKNYWSQMLDALYSYGASVDQVHQDNEYNFSLMWSMDILGSFKTPVRDALVNDSRYTQPWQGLTSWKGIMDIYGATSGEIFNYYSGLTSYTIWNYISSKYVGKVFDEIFYQTTKLKNQNVIVSNYNFFKTDAVTNTQKIEDAPPEANGHPVYVDSIVGNAAAPYLYGEMAASVGGTGNDVAWKIRSADPTRFYRFFPPDGENLSSINSTRWSKFLITLQTVRAIKRSDSSIPITPWVSSENYFAGYAGSIVGVPTEDLQDKINFYFEAIRHMALTGTKHFLWWNDYSITRNNNGQIITQSHFNNMSNVLEEVNSKIGGFTPSTMVTERISYYSQYLISGAPAASGGYWWRVTPKPGFIITVNGVVINSSTEVGVWMFTTTPDVPVCTNVVPV